MGKQERKEARDLFFALLSDKPVAYHPMIARIIGDVKQALFICQLLYWHDKGNLADGWIWKTQQEWTRETGLSRYEQETARKQLIKKKLLQEKLKGIPATLHYRLDLPRLYELTEEWCKQKQQSDITANKVAETPQSKIAEIPQSISEITTEYTENTPVFKKSKPKPEPADPVPDAFERVLELPDNTPIERIIAAVAIALQISPPLTDRQLKPYDNLVNAVYQAFNDGKHGRARKPLDHDQATETIKAIEWCVSAATHNGKVQYPWNSSAVTDPVINQVVTAISARSWEAAEQQAEAAATKEAHARETMLRLAKEHGHA